MLIRLGDVIYWMPQSALFFGLEWESGSTTSIQTHRARLHLCC